METRSLLELRLQSSAERRLVRALRTRAQTTHSPLHSQRRRACQQISPRLQSATFTVAMLLPVPLNCLTSLEDRITTCCLRGNSEAYLAMVNGTMMTKPSLCRLLGLSSAGESTSCRSCSRTRKMGRSNRPMSRFRPATYTCTIRPQRS